MDFYRTILGYRRLALIMFALLAAHMLLFGLAVYAIIRYAQMWAIPVLMWLPLMLAALRLASGWLGKLFLARDDDVLAASGLRAAPPAGGDAHSQAVVNVAAEIAIATGNSQPEVLICDSPGLNALLSFEEGTRRQGVKVIFTSGLTAALNRNELQGVVARLYAHRHNFERMFITMVAAMFFTIVVTADIFLLLNTLNWNYGGSGDFNTGPLVVVLTLGVIAGPLAAARLVQLAVMRRACLHDDITALEITRDPDSLMGALGKLAGTDAKLEATYDYTSVHYYFDAVRDRARKFPWQRLATHPAPAARRRHIAAVTGTVVGE